MSQYYLLSYKCYIDGSLNTNHIDTNFTVTQRSKEKMYDNILNIESLNGFIEWDDDSIEYVNNIKEYIKTKEHLKNFING